MVLSRQNENSAPTPFSQALQAFRDQRAGKRDAPERPQRGLAIKTARRLPPDQLAALIRDYRAGATVYELAPRYGIDRRTIAAKLRQAGVTMRGHSPSHEEADRLIELYQSGLSLVSAGEQVGYTSRTVLRVLIERGVPRRDSHGRVRPPTAS